MERLLILIKHRFTFIWNIIEFTNGLLFTLLFKGRLLRTLNEVFTKISNPDFSYRLLNYQDATDLYALIARQPKEDLIYFHPHSLDLRSIRVQLKKRAFIMMGTFEGNRLVGYFFLRFFVNRKSFVGRLVDRPYRGIGVGNLMNEVMYEISWRMNFRCLSTISRNNLLVMNAHSKNSNLIVLRELADDYLLVEFVRNN